MFKNAYKNRPNTCYMLSALSIEQQVSQTEKWPIKDTNCLILNDFEKCDNKTHNESIASSFDITFLRPFIFSSFISILLPLSAFAIHSRDA